MKTKDKLKVTWEDYYKHPLTEEEKKEIEYNLSKVFELLLEWDKKK